MKKYINRKEINRTRVQMNKKGLSFGMFSYILLVGLICFLITLVEMINWAMMNISINSSYNTLECYILGIELWNSLFSYGAFASTTITFNNSYPAWTNQSTYDLGEYLSAHAKTNVIQNMTDL